MIVTISNNLKFNVNYVDRDLSTSFIKLKIVIPRLKF